MKHKFLIVLLLSFLISCKSTTTTAPPATDNTLSLEENENIYFKATGNEPFWALSIGNEKIIFTSLMEGIKNSSFSTQEPVKSMDANVKTYQANSPKSSIQIFIQQMECQNTMSGLILPYKVSVEIKNNSDAEFKKIEGCGTYITDYRLHDIWVLEELNGFKVSETDFQKELPRIEINAQENKFMGFGGCNAISGTLFYEKDLLRFTKVIATLMACSNNNKEDEFVKALQSTTTYTIENNRLSLLNPSGKLLVFRKVD